MGNFFGFQLNSGLVGDTQKKCVVGQLHLSGLQGRTHSVKKWSSSVTVRGEMASARKLKSEELLEANDVRYIQFHYDILQIPRYFR